ncbi:MAG: MFS transporter [Acidobacteriota bacterium]|nr:MFS transporter [Acidobacteriota bacterium]
MRTFHQILLNTMLANITTSMVWFGLVFWAYLETRSVFVTSVLGGAYMLLIAAMSVPFGTLIDRVRKKTAMVVATAATAGAFAIAAVMFLVIPVDVLLDPGGLWFWAFVLVLLVGTVVESIRSLALATCVTMLVPSPDRAKANGLVGMVQGAAFAFNSVVAGLAIGYLGMGWLLVCGVALIGVSWVHLLTIRLAEPEVVHAEGVPAKVDFVAAFRMAQGVPGLLALIFFSTFNNLLGGVFAGLLDPYGLELVSVQAWGLLYAVVTTGYIIGGAVIARTGLGSNPVRTLLLANVVMWTIAGVFTIRESIVLLSAGMFLYMGLITFAEASEQTVLQKVVPFPQQGRVFGFAMALELGAAPFSTFLIGPIAEFWLIPYMETDAGRATFGWLLGEGDARGIALVFLIASVVGLAITVLALLSRPYRTLSASYRDATVNETLV